MATRHRGQETISETTTDTESTTLVTTSTTAITIAMKTAPRDVVTGATTRAMKIEGTEMNISAAVAAISKKGGPRKDIKTVRCFDSDSSYSSDSRKSNKNLN